MPHPLSFGQRPARRALLGGIALLLLFTFLGARHLLGPEVAVLTVRQGELLQSVVASGKVRSPQRVELASQISGRVLTVNGREGQAVAAGELLIQLDDAEWQAAVAQSRASLAQSETRLRQMQQLARPLAEQARRQAAANLDQARRHFERTRDLAERGFYSRHQLDDAQRNLDVAASQLQATELQLVSNQNGGSDYRLAQVAVDQAQASLALAESRLAYTRILAPSAGTVLTRSVEPGHTAQPGKVLMTLSPAGDTELLVHIDEKNLALLKPGQVARASADAYPEEHFAATINFISPAVDPLRGSVEVRLHVARPPAYLRQEMTVSIDIETARLADALLVPADAVHDTGSGNPWVPVVRDAIVYHQEIEIAARSAGRIAVRKGLSPGDAVIAAGQPVPPAGSRVRLKAI
ncbi:MAG: efflux RND transporter periplasmic adaptor subunit [Dechloromonas sp.]|nr:MAG: efflux RND transporter periplasmic adaptor subunit [Dechloromonas sp.]